MPDRTRTYLALNVSRLSAGTTTGLDNAFDWFGESELPASFRVDDPVSVRLTLLVTLPVPELRILDIVVPYNPSVLVLIFSDGNLVFPTRR